VIGDADSFWAFEFKLSTGDHEFINNTGRGGFCQRSLIVPLK